MLAREEERRRKIRLALFLGGILVLSQFLLRILPDSPVRAGRGEFLRVRLSPDPVLLRIQGEDLELWSGGRRILEPCQELELRRQALGFLLLPPTGPPRILDASSCRLNWEGRARIELQDSLGRAGVREEIGYLMIRPRGEGLGLVLHTDLELYLAGVLQGEMGPSFPMEALKAQAVAARSYALNARLRSGSRDFDLFDDSRSQNYPGPVRSPPLLRAVGVTRGQVLLHRGRPLRAYYGATCGGRTREGRERFQDVPEGTLPSVACEGCRGAPLYRWKRRIPGRDLAFLGSGPYRIRPLKRNRRGDWIRFRLEKGGPEGRPASELVRHLDLPSTWITEARPTRDGGLLLSGRGFGHCVGLCQAGARGYALEGWDYRRILAHYYRATLSGG